ncbi:MAG TPA: preprotein translocase subunit SecA [Gammaproteobacteria bacterium]|jgi:preprotein translocase subunit SecA|nr:preprotein translocase subunit SecA [Gammaproteobacteria bacterium]
MALGLLKKVFGSRNERLVSGMQRPVARINALEAGFRELSDEALKDKTAEFRARLEKGESLDDLLPEAFAAVREVARRHMRMRHFDVQLIGGQTLHMGKIAEMRTGEGKTLVATLAAYLNAIPGHGVHVVTVNDYLAQRDADWMRPVYEALGMTVGVVLAGQEPPVKREAYAADITYGTNNEFGFDYLRDNMAFRLEDKVQRELHYAIVDEVDSILIDEARTPLIISGAVDDNTDLYRQINKLVPALIRQQEEEGPGDYSVDEKAKQVYLTEDGHQRIEEMLMKAGLLAEGESLYDASNIGLMHHVNAALRALALYQREVDYIVKDGEVVIVDEFTGRTMPGRRWSDGLHQAIEAKEGVKVQAENQTLASITFQNYFRLYTKLSGMTGTADTEASEFHEIYGLEVVVIPTNKPMVRKDMPDQVYTTTKGKFEAVIADIKDANGRGQPVLVGTASIDTSEYLSGLLKKARIQHEVLNAKQHEREAHIIAQAGRPGTVTIATNMAGRGTDIVLGGSLEEELKTLPEGTSETERDKIRQAWQQRHDAVLAAGGLHIIGSERHESRRVDNQLRGRSGRQGDAGSSRFYLALDDNLMRIFAGDRVKAIMDRFGVQEHEAIEHPWVTRAVENAQRKVEAHNFDIRKSLLEYDDVANAQRKEIYALRSELLKAQDISSMIQAHISDVMDNLVNTYIPPQSVEEQWDIPGLSEAMDREFGLKLDIKAWLDSDASLHEEPLRQKILQHFTEAYQLKEQQTGAEVLRQFEKSLMLQVLDNLWREHLANMDYLRQGIHLRGYAQVDPKQEYKREAFGMFATMVERLKHDVVSILAKVQVRTPDDVAAVEEQRRRSRAMQFQHAEVPTAAGAPAAAGENAPPPVTTVVRDGRKVGRNEPCPCGSGLKYKQCHGRLA